MIPNGWREEEYVYLDPDDVLFAHRGWNVYLDYEEIIISKDDTSYATEAKAGFERDQAIEAINDIEGCPGQISLFPA